MQTQSFEDFDDFAASIRGVESRMMLRNPRNRRWDLSLVELQDVEVQLGLLGSGNIAAGELSADKYLLYMPLTEGCEYSTNGIVLEKDELAILDPGSEFCVSTKTAHDWCAVTVPKSLLDHQGDGVEALPGSEMPTLRVTRANREVADRLRAVVGQIMSTATTCPQFESSPAATSASAELLKVVWSIMGQRQATAPPRGGRRRHSRREIIRRSGELLEQRHGEPIRVTDLAAAAKVSERTLRKVFNEYYGVAPARYLQLRQLHQVRRALHGADRDAGTSVSEILVRHGEWEFGRFAARYRRLFGELPSETLQAKGP